MYKPVKTLYYWLDQEVSVIYQAKLEKMVTDDKSVVYLDVFYDKKDNIHAVYYDSLSKKDMVKTIDLNNKVISDKELSEYKMGVNLNSPYLRVNVKNNDYRTSNRNDGFIVYIRNKSTKIPYVDMLEGNEYTVLNDEILYTGYHNDFLSIYKVKVGNPIKKSVKLTKNDDVIEYNPFFFNKINTLVYSVISKYKGQYMRSLVFRKGDEKPVVKILRSDEELKIKPIKYSLNSSGNLLTIIDENSPSIQFIKMDTYPFILDDNKKEKLNNYKYTFEIGLKKINKILSMSFSDNKVNDFIVLGIPEGRVLPQIYKYNLVQSSHYRYSLTNIDYFFSLLSYLIFMGFFFIYNYLRKEYT